MRLLIHYIRAIELCLSLCFTNLAVKAQDQTKGAKLSLHDRGWIATQVYSAITTYFGHWRAVPELDLDKEFQSYLDQILVTDDRRDFDLASMELIAKLKNGHSGSRDNWLIDNYGQMLGFYACPIDKSWVVTRSSIANLKVGDVITRINQQSVEDFFLNVRRYLTS